jgi:hypothetical protein
VHICVRQVLIQHVVFLVRLDLVVMGVTLIFPLAMDFLSMFEYDHRSYE